MEKLGDVASWAEAYGAVLAVSIALLKRDDERNKILELEVKEEKFAKEVAEAFSMVSVLEKAKTRLNSLNWQSRAESMEAFEAELTGLMTIMADAKLDPILTCHRKISGIEVEDINKVADGSYQRELPHKLVTESITAIDDCLNKINNLMKQKRANGQK